MTTFERVPALHSRSFPGFPGQVDTLFTILKSAEKSTKMIPKTLRGVNKIIPDTF